MQKENHPKLNEIEETLGKRFNQWNGLHVIDSRYSRRIQ